MATQLSSEGRSGGRKRCLLLICLASLRAGRRLSRRQREVLAARRLVPGDALGTENEIAAHWKVSRIVARDALRTLQALRVMEIRVGAGGGARIAASNPDLFADAFGIQLDLMGVSPGEVLDSQRAIECLSAELAAENGTAEDHAALRDLLDRAGRCTGDADAFRG